MKFLLDLSTNGRTNLLRFMCIFRFISHKPELFYQQTSYHLWHLIIFKYQKSIWRSLVILIFITYSQRHDASFAAINIFILMWARYSNVIFAVKCLDVSLCSMLCIQNVEVYAQFFRYRNFLFVGLFITVMAVKLIIIII